MAVMISHPADENAHLEVRLFGHRDFGRKIQFALISPEGRVLTGVEMPLTLLMSMTGLATHYTREDAESAFAQIWARELVPAVSRLWRGEEAQVYFRVSNIENKVSVDVIDENQRQLRRDDLLSRLNEARAA